MGRLECKNSRYYVNFTRMARIEKDKDVLMQQLGRFSKSDNAGLIPDCKVSMSAEDKRALAIMESSAKLVDGHYKLALPWKERVPKLPKNGLLAERRLGSC